MGICEVAMSSSSHWPFFLLTGDRSECLFDRTYWLSGLKVGLKRERGARYLRNSATAPATVSGEFFFECHWDRKLAFPGR